MTIEYESDTIRIIEQSEGLYFDYMGEYCWEKDPLRDQEFIIRTQIRVEDPRDIISRCKGAWNFESGLYFEYPGFRDGLVRKVRIVDCKDLSFVDDFQEWCGLVEFTIVLAPDDLDDYVGGIQNSLDYE